MVQNLGYTALLLGVLVVVHEFGHFLLAKLLGVKVLKFSVGFGPKLLGFVKGETEYRLSLLPLGGYVKMAGDVPGEELEGEDAKRGFLAQAPWKRGLIVAAGPVFNLAFPIIVYWVMLASYAQPSTRILSLEPGLPAAEAKLQIGDRVTSVNGHHVNVLEQMRRELDDTAGRELTLGIDRDGQRFTTRVSPMPAPDGSAQSKRALRGIIGISPVAKPSIVGVPPGSPAAKAGLQTFDQIVSIDGKPVKDVLEVTRALETIHGATVHLRVARSSEAPLPGVPAALVKTVEVELPRQPGAGLAALGAEAPDLYVERVVPGTPAAKSGLVPGDRLVSFNGKPLASFWLFELSMEPLAGKPFTLGWQHGTELKTAEVHQEKSEAKEDGGRLTFGAEPAVGSLLQSPTVDRVQLGLGTAATLAFWRVEDATAQTAAGIWSLIVRKSSFDNVGSIISIYRLTAQSVQAGPEYFLHLMAMISVSLGLMNLLPIPILDGFHLIAALWEGVRRRPIPVRVREVANLVGLAMLILLMVMAIHNDIVR